MTAETENAEHQALVEFDVSQGDWRVTGTYADQDNIVIYYQGELFRRITVPGYKIWNVAAHLDEFVESCERARVSPSVQYAVRWDDGDIEPRRSQADADSVVQANGGGEVVEREITYGPWREVTS